jgi:serine/threonine-protein kinase
MGQVYLARLTGLRGFERQVVVKTLDPQTLDDETLVHMFLDEARLLGALHHQYIAPVYEVGCDDEGRYFLVMDYVRGETAEGAWKAAAAAGGSPPLGFAITIVAAVASALEYAHALRAPDGTPLEIVHRDVSLSNIMIGHDGAVKLIDFGIAKFAKRTTQTQVGSLKGKLAYLSPEQILSKPVDRRADIFALGIVLYELTTLARCFEGDSELLTLEKITKGDVALPSQVVASYPRQLERIVMKALALDPKLRYQDAGQMCRDLEAFAAAHSVIVGHKVIADTMRVLFDGVVTPVPRRRFARASSEVETGRHALPDPDVDDDDPENDTDDVDITPVQAMEPIDTAPVEAMVHYNTTDRQRPMVEESPTVPIEPVFSSIPITMASLPPPPPIAAPPPDIAPLVIRIGTPTPPRALSPVTSTAQVPRKTTSRRFPPTAIPVRWWWPLVLVGVAVLVAVIVALV